MVRIAWTSRSNPIYPSAICFGLLMMLTEVPLTIHIYGLSFVIVVAQLIALITVAGARSLVQKPAVEKQHSEQFSGVTRQAGLAPARPFPRGPYPARGLQ